MDATPTTVEPLDVPRFSLTERDRRWARVREFMTRDGVDVIVAPNATGAWNNQHANVRYLTGVGGNCAPAAAIFPVDGDVTAVTGPVPSREHWLGRQDWVLDVRPTFFGLTNGLLERLRELDPKVIAIAGLAGLPRTPEGTVPHGTYVAIAEAFPDAEIVNGTELLDEARYIKGTEELEALRKSVALVEAAIDVLAAEARPGVPECVVYARMVSTMVELGGEFPVFMLWQAGWPQTPRNWMQPTRRPLQRGDLISAETEAKWMGYSGQISHQAVVGPIRPQLAEMFEVQQAAFAACCAALVPGARLGDLIPITASVADGTPYRCQLILHGRGLGDDPPLAIFGTEFGGQDQRMKNWLIEENTSFMVKPLVLDPAGVPWVCWGDSVVVTSSGVERLGTRNPEILVLDG